MIPVTIRCGKGVVCPKPRLVAYGTMVEKVLRPVEPDELHQLFRCPRCGHERVTNMDNSPVDFEAPECDQPVPGSGGWRTVNQCDRCKVLMMEDYHTRIGDGDHDPHAVANLFEEDDEEGED